MVSRRCSEPARERCRRTVLRTDPPPFGDAGRCRLPAGPGDPSVAMGIPLRTPALRRDRQPLGHAWQRVAGTGAAGPYGRGAAGAAGRVDQRSVRAHRPRWRALRTRYRRHEVQCGRVHDRAGALRRCAPGSSGHGRAAGDLGRGGSRPRRREAGRGTVPRARPAHRLVHHGRAVVQGSTGRPVARRPSWHPDRYLERARRAGPCRLSAQGAQSHPQGVARAGRTGRAPVGRRLRDLPADQPADLQHPRRHRRQQRHPGRTAGGVQPALQSQLDGREAGTGDRGHPPPPWGRLQHPVAARRRALLHAGRPPAGHGARGARRVLRCAAGREHGRRHVRCALHCTAGCGVHRSRAGQCQHPQGR